MSAHRNDPNGIACPSLLDTLFSFRSFLRVRCFYNYIIVHHLTPDFLFLLLSTSLTESCGGNCICTFSEQKVRSKSTYFKQVSFSLHCGIICWAGHGHHVLSAICSTAIQFFPCIIHSIHPKALIFVKVPSAWLVFFNPPTGNGSYVHPFYIALEINGW